MFFAPPFSPAGASTVVHRRGTLVPVRVCWCCRRLCYFFDDCVSVCVWKENIDSTSNRCIEYISSVVSNLSEKTLSYFWSSCSCSGEKERLSNGSSFSFLSFFGHRQQLISCGMCTHWQSVSSNSFVRLLVTLCSNSYAVYLRIISIILIIDLWVRHVLLPLT